MCEEDQWWVLLFVAGAVLGEVALSLFVAGAVFGEVQVSFIVAGTVFGEVELSLFVAGAAFGEIWNDGRSAKCCIFQHKMVVVGVKSNLGGEAGCGLTVSWSDHARIMVGTVSDPSRIVNDVSSVLEKFLWNFGESFCAAGAVFGEVGQWHLLLRAL